MLRHAMRIDVLPKLRMMLAMAGRGMLLSLFPMSRSIFHHSHFILLLQAMLLIVALVVLVLMAGRCVH